MCVNQLKLDWAEVTDRLLGLYSQVDALYSVFSTESLFTQLPHDV